MTPLRHVGMPRSIAILMLVVAAGCGGGGDDNPATATATAPAPALVAAPSLPTVSGATDATGPKSATPASLVVSEAEALGLMKMSLDGARLLENQQAQFAALDRLPGVPRGGAGGAGGSLDSPQPLASAGATSFGVQHPAGFSTKARAIIPIQRTTKAIEIVGAAELCDGVTLIGCSGLATIDTRETSPPGSGFFNAGDYFAITWNRFSFSIVVDGVPTSLELNGLTRFDFLTRSELSSSPTAGWIGRIRYTTQALSGRFGDEAFGPQSFVIVIDYTPTGFAVVNGPVLVSNLNVVRTSDQTFTIVGGNIRADFDDKGYVDLDYGNFTVQSNTVGAGSTVTVKGANGATATIRDFTQSGATVTANVVYAVPGAAARTFSATGVLPQ
jgi:hypothetical protein